METEELKVRIQEEVDAHRQELIDLSLKIHANPELGWREEKASAWLADCLEKNGFEVERGICDLPTAFRASYGEGKPVIAFLSEYDALPDIGHGCGHNIIATTGVGAGIAAKLLADQFGAKVLVMGCPAEELLGGKIIMVEKGAFDAVDVAMIVHPIWQNNWAGLISLANIFLEVEFHGKEAHASADPWDGISALEALTLAFNNINALRLHVKDRGRISGIITDGGKAANVIPKHAAGTFQIRAPEDAYLDELREKVLKCFEGAALSTGARLEYRWGLRCSVMQHNFALLQPWRKNMETLGRTVDDILDGIPGSIDTGNVSTVVPSIHPLIAISTERLTAHSAEFAAAAASDAGNRAVIDGAKALAMTAADVIAQPEILRRIKDEFAEMRKQL